MKQIAIFKPYDIGVVEVPKPKPDHDQILTKTIVTGISIGTELMYYRGAMEKLPEKWKKTEASGATFPMLPGYENVATVVEVGKDVKDFQVGDRVVHCGYHAEYCVVPRRGALPVCLKVPDSVSDEDATLSVLGTTALWAVHRGQIEYGDNVAVLGDGVVGILTALHAKNTGAEKVILIGNHLGKLEIARKAVDSGMWTLYEAEYGEITNIYKPKEKIPVAEYIKGQGRFRHFTPEMIEELQRWVDKKWQRLYGEKPE